jgi:hypothetical protein
MLSFYGSHWPLMRPGDQLAAWALVAALFGLLALI